MKSPPAAGGTGEGPRDRRLALVADDDHLVAGPAAHPRAVLAQQLDHGRLAVIDLHLDRP
jgi:hypothetical protein